MRAKTNLKPSTERRITKALPACRSNVSINAYASLSACSYRSTQRQHDIKQQSVFHDIVTAKCERPLHCGDTSLCEPHS